jgi:hypothetical protein
MPKNDSGNEETGAEGLDSLHAPLWRRAILHGDGKRCTCPGQAT